MSIRDYYTNITETGKKFSNTEWNIVVATGNTAAAISIVSSISVLVVHAFMAWYRPSIVNRLSLRMIVFSCICNMIYCACQLVADDISSHSISCRALAYVLVVFDTMSCMSLAMVGLNLVMIFVLKVSRTIKLEILYYLIIVISGLLVVILPLVAGNPKGPKNNTEDSSCWYHYYFDGRMANIFNWMCYYGVLLFSLVFAATCAAVSIRFVVKKQENFSGALDMFTRRDQKDVTTMATIRKYTNNNTDVFQRIARRCICYPLVPLISKSWGVGIEIAASQNAYIPVPIFTIDRIFSCLLGFMVSCIYFTDPAIGAVFKESIESIKQKYIYNYYSVQFIPSEDFTIDLNSQYPRLLKITLTPTHYTETTDFFKQMHNKYLAQSPGQVEVSVRDLKRDIQSHGSTTQSGFRRDSTTFQLKTTGLKTKPALPTIILNNVHGRPVEEISLAYGIRYNIISVTSKNGNIFMPNELTVDSRHADNYNSIDPEHQTNKTVICSLKSKMVTIPMYRVHNSSIFGSKVGANASQCRGRSSFSKSTETIETLVPFAWPICTKAIHWILIKIFRVKIIEIRELDEDNFSECQYGDNVYQSSNVFHDFTDSSDPSITRIPPRCDSAEFLPDVDFQNTSNYPEGISTHIPKQSSLPSDDANSDEDVVSRHSSITPSKDHASTFMTSEDSINHYCDSSTGEKTPRYPLKRVSSINVASIQRDRTKQSSNLASPLHRRVAQREMDRSSPTNRFPPSMSLARMLNRGRSVSFSWTKLTSANGKTASSASETPTSTLSLSQTAELESSSDNRTTEKTDLTSSVSNIIYEDTCNYNQNVPTKDSTTSSASNNSSGNESAGPQELFVTLAPPPPAIISSSSSPPNYLKALSPRPRSQYKRPSSSEQTQSSRQCSSTVLDSFTTLFPTEDNKHLSKLSHNSGRSQIHDLYPVQRISYASNEGPGDEQAGLSQGHTSINFVSNWQDTENVETNRTIDISEPWDLDEQLRNQLQFAEIISRL